MILEGKKILVTGVVNRHSIGFAIAERAQAQGAEVLLTSFGRVKRMTERSAARLDPAPEVLDIGPDWFEMAAVPGLDASHPWPVGKRDRVVDALADLARAMHALPIDECPFDRTLAVTVAEAVVGSATPATVKSVAPTNANAVRSCLTTPPRRRRQARQAAGAVPVAA